MQRCLGRSPSLHSAHLQGAVVTSHEVAGTRGTCGVVALHLRHRLDSQGGEWQGRQRTISRGGECGHNCTRKPRKQRFLGTRCWGCLLPFLAGPGRQTLLPPPHGGKNGGPGRRENLARATQEMVGKGFKPRLVGSRTACPGRGSAHLFGRAGHVGLEGSPSGMWGPGWVAAGVEAPYARNFLVKPPLPPPPRLLLGWD